MKKEYVKRVAAMTHTEKNRARRAGGEEVHVCRLRASENNLLFEFSESVGGAMRS